MNISVIAIKYLVSAKSLLSLNTNNIIKNTINLFCFGDRVCKRYMSGRD